MKLRILIITLLLLVAPCTAQIDFDSQVKNKSVTSGVSANAVLWTGPVDPGLNAMPINHINTKLVPAATSITTNWSVKTGNLLIVPYTGSSVTSPSTATDTFGSSFTKYSMWTGFVFVGLANGSGIDTITLSGASQGANGSTLAVSEFSGATSVVDATNNHYTSLNFGTVTTTVYGDLLYAMALVGEPTIENQDTAYPFSMVAPAVRLASDWSQALTGSYLMMQLTGVSGSYTISSTYAHYNTYTSTIALKPQTTPIVGSHDGDFYLNTSTYTLFGPKVSGSWPANGIRIGVTGFTGSKTIGSCAMTFVNGLVTTVTGC